MLKLPRFRAAAIQASPVYLNAGATVDKAAFERLARESVLVPDPEIDVVRTAARDRRASPRSQIGMRVRDAST